MEYAEWVPNAVIDFWEQVTLPDLQGYASSAQEYIEMRQYGFDSDYNIKLHKKIISRCNSAIENIPLLFSCKSHAIELKILWLEIRSSNILDVGFLTAVSRAYIGFDGFTGIMTENERKNWIKKVQNSSLELIDLIGYSRYVDVAGKVVFDFCITMLDALFSVKGDISDDVNEKLEYALFEACGDLSDKLSLSDLLYEIAATSETDIHSWHELSVGEEPRFIFLKKPNSYEADRAYFARYMTNYFGIYAGEPKRQIVLTLIHCLFGEMDERKLRDIAPWSPFDANTSKYQRENPIIPLFDNLP